MNYFPLTKGLLVSIATRFDHSFSFDKPEGDPIHCGCTERDRFILLTEAFIVYKSIIEGNNLPGSARGQSHDIERGLEEMTGAGFYSLELESSYANSWPKSMELTKWGIVFL